MQHHKKTVKSITGNEPKIITTLSKIYYNKKYFTIKKIVIIYQLYYTNSYANYSSYYISN